MTEVHAFALLRQGWLCMPAARLEVSKLSLHNMIIFILLVIHYVE